LEKKIALFTMHELLVMFADTPVTKHLSIEPDPKTSPWYQDHVIKIKYNLDDGIIEKIEPIVKTRNLKIEKLGNSIVIR
jgi:hypothetical protein